MNIELFYLNKDFNHNKKEMYLTEYEPADLDRYFNKAGRQSWERIDI
jgi:hypothetical protein